MQNARGKSTKRLKRHRSDWTHLLFRATVHSFSQTFATRERTAPWTMRHLAARNSKCKEWHALHVSLYVLRKSLR
jgi:hypothetical protein